MTEPPAGFHMAQDFAVSEFSVWQSANKCIYFLISVGTANVFMLVKTFEGEEAYRVDPPDSFRGMKHPKPSKQTSCLLFDQKNTSNNYTIN